MSPAPGGAVAYYRVSTDVQATLGYSLDAQRSLVRNYVEEQQLHLVAEHTEAESGYGPTKLEKRPNLKQALQDCRRHKLVSLSPRSIGWPATLSSSRRCGDSRRFRCIGRPDATPFMIHIYAAVAEEESRNGRDCQSGAGPCKVARQGLGAAQQAAG